MCRLLMCHASLLTQFCNLAETLMAVPEGLKVMEPLLPLASFHNEKSEKAQKEYLAATVPLKKAELAEAIKRYGI